MTLITKPDFTYVWASGGAIVAPNDTKKQQGWVSEAPPFQWDNWLQNRQDQMLAHINQRGMCAWDGLTNYEAGGLSYAQGSDGKIYKSVAASGPLTTAQDPTTDATDTYWTVAFADVGAFLTQVAGDARYAQLSNNLSDLTNAATARTNLGLADTVNAGISGSHSNLKSSATGLSAVITITADSVCLKSASNAQTVINNVNISPSISVSGVNGLDAGVSTVSTWYSVWIIWNGTTIGGLLSLSATSPTMPVGYTHKARVGWIRTDSTANKYPLSFVQAGHITQYKVASGSNVLNLPIMASGVLGSAGTPTWSAVAVANFVPTTAAAIKISARCNPSARVIVAPNSSYGAYTSTTNSPPVALSIGADTDSVVVEMLLESGNIYYAGDNPGGQVLCLGWVDNF